MAGKKNLHGTFLHPSLCFHQQPAFGSLPWRAEGGQDASATNCNQCYKCPKRARQAKACFTHLAPEISFFNSIHICSAFGASVLRSLLCLRSRVSQERPASHRQQVPFVPPPRMQPSCHLALGPVFS